MIVSRRWAFWSLGVLFQAGAALPLFGAPAAPAGVATLAETAPAPPPLRRVARIGSGAIELDGKLDEAAWRQAEAVSLAFERLPGDGIPPPVETTAYLLYDDRHLYVAFRAFDPEPAEIRAHLMDRDRLATFVQDDHVTVMLDTYDDSRRAFQFRVNPLGVQADAIFSELDGVEDFSWDMIWRSAGTIDAEGYVVELAIPFDQLRIPRGEGEQTWGIGLERSWPRDVRHRIEAHRVDRNNSCTLCQNPRFVGFAGLVPGRNLELVPSVTFDRTDEPATFGGPLVDGDENVEGGLNVRWGVTPSLTLNATFNPDFSQVEADASQLFVNERFALYLEEKRAFFLEGVDIFSTQIQAIFTRSILDPRWGVKLTGKTGASSMGFFVVNDEINAVNIPYNDRSDYYEMSGSVDTMVGRWRLDLGESSTLGVIYAGREGEKGYYNRVAGFDTHWRINENQIFRAQALGSQTDYPDDIPDRFGQDDDSFGGYALEGMWLYEDRNWLYSAGWRSYDDQFRADAGYLPQVDIETWRAQVARKFWGDPDDFFHLSTYSGLFLHTRNQEGELTQEKVELRGSFDGAGQSQTDIVAIWLDERVHGILFEGMFTGRFDFSFQPNQVLRLSTGLRIGDTVENFQFSEADEQVVQATAEIKAGRHLNIYTQVLQQTLDRDGDRLFRSLQADLKLTWQFSLRCFVRGLFQWQDIDFRPESFQFFAPPDFEDLKSQLLFSYKINPRTVLFVGYSDSRFGEAFVERDRIDLQESSRTFFVKMSYAFVR